MAVAETEQNVLFRINKVEVGEHRRPDFDLPPQQLLNLGFEGLHLSDESLEALHLIDDGARGEEFRADMSITTLKDDVALWVGDVEVSDFAIHDSDRMR